MAKSGGSRGIHTDTVLLAKEREKGGKKKNGTLCILTLLRGIKLFWCGRPQAAAGCRGVPYSPGLYCMLQIVSSFPLSYVTEVLLRPCRVYTGHKRLSGVDARLPVAASMTHPAKLSATRPLRWSLGRHRTVQTSMTPGQPRGPLFAFCHSRSARILCQPIKARGCRHSRAASTVLTDRRHPSTPSVYSPDLEDQLILLARKKGIFLPCRARFCALRCP